MAGDLHLGHARLTGPGAARETLAAALAGIAVPGLAEAELLYIPRHRSRAILRPGDPRRFAVLVTAELTEILAAAAIDPPPGAVAAAYRFTSRAAFAAWALGHWIMSATGTPSSPAPVAATAAAAAIFRSLPGGTPIGWLRRTILTDGRMLPALLAALAEHGQAAHLLARLGPPDIDTARRALALSHGLPPSPEPATALPVNDPPPGPATTPTRTRLAETIARLPTADNDPAPLSPPARQLLFAALYLHAHPAAPRAALAAEIARVADAPHFAVSAESAPAKTASPAAYPSDPETRVQTARSRAAHRPETTPRQPRRPPGIPANPPNPTPIPAAQTVSTDYGGLFFLLNAFLAMGLYPDFTRPADPGLPLAPTTVLNRLGSLHFGARYRRDPLHEMLSALDPGTPLPTDWHVRPDWLTPFPRSRPIQTTRTLWHPAGFPIADTPLRKSRTYRNRLFARCFSNLPILPQKRWLACLALYLDARLRRATGSLGLAALAIPATASLTPSTIDIRFSLNHLALPLRLAGLDRDPGWMPTEGRSIAFHFE